MFAGYFGEFADDFSDANCENQLFKTTQSKPELEEKPYNVVFIMMESFGSYYLKFHSENLNLLGEFENHLNKDYHFRNFLSSTRGTIYSFRGSINK